MAMIQGCFYKVKGKFQINAKGDTMDCGYVNWKPKIKFEDGLKQQIEWQKSLI